MVVELGGRRSSYGKEDKVQKVEERKHETGKDGV